MELALGGENSIHTVNRVKDRRACAGAGSAATAESSLQCCSAVGSRGQMDFQDIIFLAPGSPEVSLGNGFRTDQSVKLCQISCRPAVCSIDPAEDEQNKSCPFSNGR